MRPSSVVRCPPSVRLLSSPTLYWTLDYGLWIFDFEIILFLRFSYNYIKILTRERKFATEKRDIIYKHFSPPPPAPRNLALIFTIIMASIYDSSEAGETQQGEKYCQLYIGIPAQFHRYSL